MNARCPVCDLRLIREEGWFLLAMYFTYALAIPFLIGLTFFLWWLLDWHLHLVVFIALGIFALFIPLLVSYSRVLAIHFDYLVDPTPWSASDRDTAAGP